LYFVEEKLGCCGKTIKTAKYIAKGFTRLATDTVHITEKYEFTDSRIRICQKCNKNKWIGRSLWCSICKCFIPAKARVKEQHCPKGFWPKVRDKNKGGKNEMPHTEGK